MRLVEIEQLPNGAHRNQTISGVMACPEGWAVIPKSVTIPSSFPFVDIEVTDGVVTSMTEREVPEPEPVPEVDTSTSPEQLRADIDYLSAMTGVDLV